MFFDGLGYDFVGEFVESEVGAVELDYEAVFFEEVGCWEGGELSDEVLAERLLADGGDCWVLVVGEEEGFDVGDQAGSGLLDSDSVVSW